MTRLQREIASKGNYGIDAPAVVRNLFVLGVLIIIAAIFVLRLHGEVWFILSILWFAGGFVCVAEAILMLWSSRKGKGMVITALIEMLDIDEHDRILDVGCGRGFVLISLAKQISTGKIVGIDIWNTKDQSGNRPEVTLQNAEAEGVRDRVEIINADARKLPFEENTFDSIASSLAIHNISDKCERQKALKEMLRVLKSNGRIAILDFQHTQEYAQLLNRSGLQDVTVSKLYFSMFPPVRIVTGIKK